MSRPTFENPRIKVLVVCAWVAITTNSLCANEALLRSHSGNSVNVNLTPAESGEEQDPAIDEAKNNLRNNLPKAAELARKRLADPTPLSTPERAELLWIAGSALSMMGEHHEAMKLLEEGVSITGEKPLAKIRRRLLRFVAASAVETGKADRGAAAAREALQISEEIGDQTSYVALLHNELANNETRLGNIDSAIKHYRLGLEIAERDDNVGQKSMILTNLAGVYGQLKQHNEAIKILSEVLKDASGANLEPVIIGTHLSLGENHQALQNFQQAVSHFEQAGNRSTSPSTRSFLAAAKLGLGDISRLQDQVNEAATLYAEAKAIYEEVKDPSGVLAADNRLLELNQIEMQPIETIAVLEGSLTKAEETRDSSLIQEICGRLSVLYEEVQDFEKANKTLRRSLELQAESRKVAHAEELSKIHELLAQEKLRRLQGDYSAQQADISRQRQQNIILLFSLLVMLVALIMFSRLLTDRRKAIVRLESAEAEIRQQKQLQIAMERNLAEQQRTESLGLMAAGIAHDFNNLLTVITGCAELGALCNEEQKKNDLFEQVSQVAFQAADLTKQLRQFMAKPDDSRATSNLSGVIKSMLPLLNSIARPHSRVEVQEDVSDRIVTIEDAQLRQIMLNLVSNAVDALAPRGGNVSIQCHTRELTNDDLASMRGSDFARPGTYFCIEVSDDGEGISEESQRKIFDPYFSSKSVGRGLGLASVLGIVRSCRGAVQVHSLAGHGATFRVCLPKASGVSLPVNQNPRSVYENHPYTTSGQRRTVLLVDDEPMILKSMNELLVNAGFETRTAVDAKSALQVLPSIADELSVAIIDYSMPGESGVWLAQRLHEQRPNVPVIICSGYAAESIPLDMNIRTFVQKPYLPSELLKEIHRCCSADTAETAA